MSRSGFVSVSLPSELVLEIDEKMLGKMGYRSRADFINDAIRRRLEQIEKETIEQGEIGGSQKEDAC